MNYTVFIAITFLTCEDGYKFVLNDLMELFSVTDFTFNKMTPHSSRFCFK